jgi:small subunit ribosomal protein S1
MSDMFGDDNNAKNSSDDFAKMFEQSLGKTQKTFEKGVKVQAEIMTLGRDNVFVLVDGREGVVARGEFKTNGIETPLKVGDRVDLYVTKVTESLLELTPKPSHKSLADDLEEAFDFETPVEGKVIEVVNGGYRVEVLHKLAFCPFSQMDSRSTTDNSRYVGMKYSFLITKFDGGKNIVLSRRKLLDLEKAEFEGNFLQTTKPGATLQGRVSRLEKFGAFVELQGGVEGLIHISELGWSRVGHPSEVVRVGEEVTVKVLEISEDDAGRLRISLSRKQADEDPWLQVQREFPSGTTINAVIKSSERFGLLMELKPGIVGLLPKGALKESPNEREIEAKKPGEKLRVVVQSVNIPDRRVSLSLPSELDDVSWQEYSKSSNSGFGTLGDQLQGLIKKKS